MRGVAPTPDALERSIVEILKQALHIDWVQLDRSFFDQGLTSVVSQEVRARIEQRWGVNLSSSTLFDYPTVVSLRDHLGHALGQVQAGVHPPAPNHALGGFDEALIKDILKKKFGV